MKVEITEATLENYKFFTKKEDLIPHAKLTIKVVEEGSPVLIRHFTNDTYLKKIGELASNDTWKNIQLPLDEQITVVFGGVEFEGILCELAVKKNKKKQTTTYMLTIEKEVEDDDIKNIVYPFFKSREEDTAELKDPLKAPKQIPIKYECSINN